MGLSLLERVGRRQNAGRTAWSRENVHIVRALLSAQTGLPSPRKVWSRRDFAVSTCQAAPCGVSGVLL